MIERYRLNEELVFRHEGQGGIVFDPRTGGIEPVNLAGALILSAVEDKRTLDELLAEMNRIFEGTTSEDMMRDVEEFLRSCVEAGIVKLTC